MYQPSQLTSLYNQPDYKYQPPSKRIGQTQFIYHYPRHIYPPQKSVLSTKSLLSYTHHLETQRTYLFNQLSQQKLCNNRSKTIIDDLITNSKRNRNLENFGPFSGGEHDNKSKGNRSSYSEGRFKQQKEVKETQQKRGSEKGEREKTNNSFLRGNERNNLDRIQISGSIAKREQSNKAKTEQNQQKKNPTINSSVYQNNIHSNLANNTKSAIFRKLYVQSFHEPNSQKTPIKEQPQISIKSQFQLPNYGATIAQSPNISISQQIAILKEQLEQKNKMIINLQCELLKTNKNENKNKETINTSIKQIQTLATINDCESSSTNLSTKISCSFNPVCVSLTIPSTKQIQKQYPNKRFSLCQKISISVHQQNGKVLDNKNAEANAIDLNQNSINLGRQNAKPLQKSCQTIEQKRNLNLNMNQQILNLLILPIQQTQNQSTQTQTLIKAQQQTSTQTQCNSKKEEKKSVNIQTQTSECYYDYIQSTYLQWMFDKQFEQMQKIKEKKQTNK